MTDTSRFDPGAWHDADPDAPLESNDPPKPGEYEVVIAGARAFTSSKGNDIAIVEWNITAGPLTGYQWPDIYTFKNEGSIKAAKGMCARIGVDVEQVGALEDLDAALNARVGEYFRVKVVQNGNFRSTYVLGRANEQLAPRGSDFPDDGAFQSAGAGGGAQETEDIPFKARFPEGWEKLKCCGR